MARARTELFPERAQAAAAFAKAIAHPARVSILTLLAKEKELAVMAIVSRLPLSQPSCTRHLQVLEAAGLVRLREKGANVMCSIKRSRVRALSSALTDLFSK